MQLTDVMNTRRCFAGFVLIVVFCVFLLIYVNPDISVTTIAAYAFAGGDQRKTILYWNPFFGVADFYMGEGNIAYACPRFNNCFATHSRYLQKVEDFDAVIFHGINGQIESSDVPAKRRPEQKYIFVSLESPANRFVSDEFNGYYNLTMSYALNSDLVWTYADVVDKRNESIVAYPSPKARFRWRQDSTDSKLGRSEESRLIEIISGKRKLATWYRSNCETRSAREKYVAALEEHMEVAKFGKCSTEEGCSKDQDCFKIDVEPNYFFYLSFENSLCTDYVTEKFFHALQYYIVPVVYGGADYSLFAPPKSYINALDFDTPKDLAAFLKQLSLNMTEYKTYFDWKKNYRVISSKQRIICDLCEIINRDQKKTYDISKWYSTNTCPLQSKLNKQKAHGGLPYVTKRTLLVQ